MLSDTKFIFFSHFHALRSHFKDFTMMLWWHFANEMMKEYDRTCRNILWDRTSRTARTQNDINSILNTWADSYAHLMLPIFQIRVVKFIWKTDKLLIEDENTTFCVPYSSFPYCSSSFSCWSCCLSQNFPPKWKMMSQCVCLCILKTFIFKQRTTGKILRSKIELYLLLKNDLFILNTRKKSRE